MAVARYRRWSDRDRHLGPYVLVSRNSKTWSPLALVLQSGDGDERPGCCLRLSAFGWTAIIELPEILKPWVNPKSSWDRHSREFGFSLSEGFLQVFLGPQTHDSTTTKSWCAHLPWTQWRHIRTSQFDDKGEHYFTEWSRPRGFKLRDNWSALYEVRKRCPAEVFEFDDYDGKRIKATTTIEERHYKFGEGWFKWLSLFRRDMVRRSLNLEFSEEVGPEKGSWKGGTTGHSIEMLPGEMHEAAFRRYCEQEHSAKGRRYRIRYVGRSEVR